MPKPELGALAPGQKVMVLPEPERTSTPAPIEAEVTKIGRVWVDLKAVNGSRTWRMKIASQCQETGIGYGGDRFAALHQYAWQQKVDAARRALNEANLLLEYRSIWAQDEDRLLALAQFVREYDAYHGGPTYGD